MSDLVGFRRLFQLQRRRVHAVSEAGRVGSVGEDVAEVGAALSAAGLGPDHAVTGVGGFLHRLLTERLEEARPARPGLELRLRGEQGLTADDAYVGAVVVAVPILAGEGSFGAGLLGDLVLLGRQPGTELGVGRDVRT